MKLNKRGTVGRADLLRVMGESDRLRDELAAALGFEREIPERGEAGRHEPESKEERPSVRMAVPFTQFRPRPVPFWRLESCHARDRDKRGAEAAPGPTQLPPSVVRVPFPPLATVAELLTSLRRMTNFLHPGNEVDVDRLVDLLGRGKMPASIPRRQKRTWGGNLHVIEDLAPHLYPYRLDQAMVALVLKQLIPESQLTICSTESPDVAPYTYWPESADLRWKTPAPGATVLVLGDLGLLRGTTQQRLWQEFGQTMRLAQVRCTALIPCGSDRLPVDMARTWNVSAWESRRSATLPPEQEQAVARRLLGLLSFAITIEPRLLRRVRRLLPETRGLAELESIVWQLPELQSAGVGACLLRQSARGALETARLEEPVALRELAVQAVRSEHADAYSGVRFAEILNLGDEACHHYARSEIEAARLWFADPEGGLGNEREKENRLEFFRAIEEYVGSMADRSVLGRAWAWRQAHQPDAAPPNWIDPRALTPRKAGIKTLALRQRGGRLIWRSHADSGQDRGSPLGTVRFEAERVRVDFFERVAPEAFTVPPWATRAGTDALGRWCEIEFVRGNENVVQRLRWVPAGRFRMGSPGDEVGRDADEGPVHDVQLTRAFWLFDTPVRQGLWELVMDKNPSHVKGSELPVEQVSWEDCRAFCDRVGELIPGLGLELPTEAEWEYACRAGTEGAHYGMSMGRELKDIAWYGRNSGGQTHAVGEKLPNAWGLYDMLGHVWEWCRDGKRRYAAREESDPLGPLGASAGRLVRGGSWYDAARHVRAAYRYWNHPDGRYDDLGFRCRVQSSEPGSGGEGAAGGQSGEAEPRSDRSRATGRRSRRADSPKAHPGGRTASG